MNKIKTALSTSILLIIIGLIAGCGAGSHIWGNPDTGLILLYRFPVNTPFTYKTSMDQNQTMEMMGNSREIKVAGGAVFTTSCTGMKDKNYSLSTVIDSISFSANGMGMMGNQKPDFSQLIGKKLTIILSSQGDEKEIIGGDSLAYTIGGQKQKVKNQFQNIFPKLPSHPVKISDAWPDTTEKTMKQNGMDITINMVLKNVIEGFEKVNGYECVKIKSTGTGTMDGAGETNGASVSIEGDIESNIVYYFAYKTGTFIKLHNSTTTESTVSVTGPANMTIPVSGETVTDIKLVK